MKECDAIEAAMDAVNYIENVKKATTVDVASDRFFGPETILDGGMTTSLPPEAGQPENLFYF